MPKPFELERVADSLSTISSIIFHRLKTMECNPCEPCGPVFMNALKVLREAGTPDPAAIKGNVGAEQR